MKELSESVKKVNKTLVLLELKIYLGNPIATYEELIQICKYKKERLIENHTKNPRRKL